MEWPLLSPLAPAEREQLLASTRRRTYARGEVLVREGEPSDSLHLVESGRLAVRVDTSDGDTAIFNVIGPGDCFGELSLVGGGAQVRTATVVALEEATTRSVTTAVFEDLRSRHADIGEFLLDLFARRIGELSARLVEVMYDGLDRRVHRRLLDLVGTYGTDGSGPVTIPLTQEQLAQLVGGTRPSVNEVLQRLAGQGVVELGRGRVVVLRPEVLAGSID
jgi:CRP-like cAMP-binding protein